MADPQYVEIRRTVGSSAPARLAVGTDLTGSTFEMVVPSLSVTIAATVDVTAGVISFAVPSEIENAAPGVYRFYITRNPGHPTTEVVSAIEGAWVIRAVLATSPSGISWPSVVAMVPEAATLPNEVAEDILQHVNTVIDVTLFGGESSRRVRMLRLNLAWHMAAMRARAITYKGEVVGAVTSDRAGDVSTSYASPTSGSDGDAFYASTPFGVEYLSLIRTSPARGGFVV